MIVAVTMSNPWWWNIPSPPAHFINLHRPHHQEMAPVGSEGKIMPITRVPAGTTAEALSTRLSQAFWNDKNVPYL